MFSRKQIWSLLIPLMIEQVLASLMGTADTMMVSKAGQVAMAAVSLVDTLNILIIYVFSALATGGAIICAQYLGRKEPEEANESARQLIFSLALISTACTLIFVFLREPLLRLIFGRVEEAVMADAKIYLLITALSYPCIALYNAGASLFRVDGNSRLPMTVSIISNVINVAGNALLIFVFDMGAAGAAIATLVSRAFCMVMILICLRQPRQSIVVRDYRSIRPQPKRILNIMAIGIPNGIENGMFQFGKLAIQSTVSMLGTVAIAAQSMTAVLEGLASHTQLGIHLGLMTIMGQCMGAGRVQEARYYIKKLTLYSEITTVIVCAIVALAARPISVIAGMEQEAADLMCSMVYTFCIFKPVFWSLSFAPAYGFRAAGDVRFSMIVSTITMWTCRVVVAIFCMRVLKTGPVGVWYGMIADWILRGAIFTWRFYSMRWANKQVIRS